MTRQYKIRLRTLDGIETDKEVTEADFNSYLAGRRHLTGCKITANTMVDFESPLLGTHTFNGREYRYRGKKKKVLIIVLEES